MLDVRVRYGESIPHWKQKASQRGASRVMPRKNIIARLGVMTDYFKIIGYIVLSLVFAVVVYNVVNRIAAYINQPIAKVTVLGEFGYIDQQTLQNRIEPFVNTGFLDVNLEQLRHKLETTPWISHVEIERVWPNELKINLNGRQPIARWGAHGLLNNVGEPFLVKDVSAYKDLPLLAGPDDAHVQVMQQYQIISQLLRPMDFFIASLTLEDTGHWTVVTNTGLELVLGNNDIVDRLRRFNRAYDFSLKDKIDNIARVDLRYNNAMAVAWKDPSKEIETNKATKMLARQ